MKLSYSAPDMPSLMYSHSLKFLVNMLEKYTKQEYNSEKYNRGEHLMTIAPNKYISRSTNSKGENIDQLQRKDQLQVVKKKKKKKIALLKHTPISCFIEIIFNSTSPFQRKRRQCAVNLEMSRISYSICLGPGRPPGLSQCNSSDRIQTRTLPILSPRNTSSTSTPVGCTGFGK